MGNYYYVYPDELAHYGVLGMKWDKRRYQNSDGSLTSLGKKHEKYKAIKKQGKTGYAESMGNGSYAVWKNKRAFNKNINTFKKKELAKASSFKEKQQIRNDYRKYKSQVDAGHIVRKSIYRESAKLVKDSMKAEVKGIPVSKVTAGRHKTERILDNVAFAGLVVGSLAGYVAFENYIEKHK